MMVGDLLVRIHEAGGTLEPRGDRLRVRASEPLPDTLLEELRAHKAEVLAHLRGEAVGLPAHVGDWPAEWLEAFIERAGIMEFDGGLPREEAEARAEELVREAHRRAQERQV